MSRRGSRRQRHRIGNTLTGGTAVALKPPPGSNPALPPIHNTAAIPMPARSEPLVTAARALTDTQFERLEPLPPSLSLVDPRMPLMRRVRLWFFTKAERWVERRKPLPEQPTIAQLDRLRKDLASMQRKLDKMLG